MKPEGSVTSLQENESISERSRGSVLNYDSCGNSLATLTPEAVEKPAISLRQAHIAHVVFCFLQIVISMDASSIAGLLPSIQPFFDISDESAGLLQTVYSCSVLLFTPLCGYLGDRYNRRYIMMGGLSVFIVTGFASSFVTESQFWLLVLLRAGVAIGNSSFSVTAGTIISDIFSGDRQSVMLCAFAICAIVGSGLGLLFVAGITTLTKGWRWTLRITPIFGLVGVVSLGFFSPNPARGASETNGEGVTKKSSYLEDIKYLLKNKSYLWSNVGVMFGSGCSMAILTYWTPAFMSRARVTQGILPSCTNDPCDPTDSYILGAVSSVAPILGAGLATYLIRWLRDKVANEELIVSTAGTFASGPCFFIAIFVASESIPVTYVFLCLGYLMQGCVIANMYSILMGVVTPSKRGTTWAINKESVVLISGASVYLVGVVSDALCNFNPATHECNFLSLKHSLLIAPCSTIPAGFFFLVASRYYTEGKKAAQEFIEGEDTRCDVVATQRGEMDDPRENIDSQQGPT